MDFSFGEEQEFSRKAAKDFAEKKIAPTMEEDEKEHRFRGHPPQPAARAKQTLVRIRQIADGGQRQQRTVALGEGYRRCGTNHGLLLAARGAASLAIHCPRG